MRTAKMAVSYLLVLVLMVSSFVSIPMLDFDNHVYAKDATSPEYKEIGGFTFFFANGTPIVVKDGNDIDSSKYPERNNNTAIQWSGQSETLVLTGAGLIIFGGGHSTDLESSSITFDGGKAYDVFAGGLHNSKVTTANLEINGGTISSSYGGGASLFTNAAENTALDCSSKGCTTPTNQSEVNNTVVTANVTVNDGNVKYVNGGGQGYSQTGAANTTINGGEIYLVTGTGANGKTDNANVVVNGGTIDWLQSLNRGILGDAAIEVNGGTITTLSALSNNLPDNGGTFEGGVSVSIKGGTVDTFTMGKQEYGGSAITDPSDLPPDFDLELNLNKNAITNIDSAIDNFDDYTTSGRPLFNGLITDKDGNGGIFWHAALASETAIKLNDHFGLTGDAQLNSRSIIDTASLGAITEFEYDGDDNAYNKKVSALVGFDYFTNLQALNMPNNNVQDVSFIKNLANLASIDLSGNRVVDLSQFSAATLTALTELDLSNNTSYPADSSKPTKLADIDGVQWLSSLQKLNLSNNNIMDLGPMSTLTSLRDLDISDNSCWDYVEGTSTSGPKLEDLTPLNNMNALETLNASDNAIADISVLTNLGALEDVDLSKNLLANAAPLQSVSSIKNLNLDNNKIKDLSYVSSVTTLSALDQIISGEAVSSSSIKFEATLPVKYVNGTAYNLTTSEDYKLVYDAASNKVKVSDFPVDGTELKYDYSYKSGSHAISGTVTHDVSITNAKLDVTFQAKGGTVSPATKEVVRGGSYGTLPTPAKDGYTFEGWYSAADAGDLVTADSEVTATSDHSLYAKWAPANYTVTFDSNGGSAPNPATKGITYGEVFGELPEVTREGYTFLGWYYEKPGRVEVLATTIVDVTEDTTLYARWIANDYKVTFDKNGGDSVSDESKTVTYDYEHGELPVATRAGYTFMGWYTDATSGDEVKASDIVKTASDKTLYAKWKANDYKVTLNVNGGSKLSNSTKTVTRDATYGTLPTPKRKGHSFLGWYTAKSGGTKITAGTKVTLTGDQVLYAKWKAKTYKLVFTKNAKKVKNLKMKSKKVKYGSKIGKLPKPKKAGYKFKGWYTKKKGGKRITTKSTMKYDKNIRLYAKWKKRKG